MLLQTLNDILQEKLEKYDETEEILLTETFCSFFVDEFDDPHF